MKITFVCALVILTAVEGRKPLRSLFTNLLTHDHGNVNKKKTSLPTRTATTRSESPFNQYTKGRDKLQVWHNHPVNSRNPFHNMHVEGTTSSATTTSTAGESHPSSPPVESTWMNDDSSTTFSLEPQAPRSQTRQRFDTKGRKENASILSKHFRIIPIVFLLQLVVKAGIAEANNESIAQLYRMFILHMTFGVFLGVSKNPSFGLICILQFFVSTLSLVAHLHGMVLQLIVYGSISVWLLLLLFNRNNDTSLFLQERLPAGLAIAASAFMLVAPTHIDFESTKLLPGILVIFLYFDLLTRLLFPPNEPIYKSPNTMQTSPYV